MSLLAVMGGASACADGYGAEGAPEGGFVIVGAMANALLQSVSSPDATGAVTTSTVSGNATFVVTQAGVDLTLDLTGCAADKRYRAELHLADDCQNALTAIARGAQLSRVAIDDYGCGDAVSPSSVFYSQGHTSPERWTVEDVRSATNVVGWSLVLRDRADGRVEACGMVQLVQSGAAGAGAGPSVVGTPGAAGTPGAGNLPGTGTGMQAVLPPAIRAELAGVCQWQRALPSVTANAGCPDVTAVVQCADLRCNPLRCSDLCAQHIVCLSSQPDVCAATAVGGPCEVQGPCLTCIAEEANCIQGSCAAELSCGP